MPSLEVWMCTIIWFSLNVMADRSLKAPQYMHFTHSNNGFIQQINATESLAKNSDMNNECHISFLQADWAENRWQPNGLYMI